MARIPKNIVDQIYAATDIIGVVGDYVQLKKRGGNHWGLSPFVNEKTPSFAVNPKKNIYKDFSSGKGGNAINFLIEMEGYSYVEALKHLAKKYGIELEEEEETEEQKVSRNKRESLFIVNEFAAGWWHDQLMLSEEGKKIGLSYFKERGLLQATIDDFQLGYAPDAWQALVNAAADRQYKEEFLEELSLATRSEKNGNLFDRFRGRVMFPITNVSGKVVGFGGRILGNKKDTAKYINSSESEIYHKSKVLYGLYQARQEIRSKDLCILTEGYMDVILLAQNGIKNVVASSGTALTLDQIRLIRRFTEKVLMIYDGDAAGVKAALRGIDLLVQEGMKSEVLILPDNHDPDSYIREFGANGFQEFAKAEALSFVDFKMRVLTEGRDAEDPQVQTEVVKALADTLALQDDLIERQMYIKRLAQRLDISESLMTHAVEQAIQARAKIAQQEAKREEARKARERNQNSQSNQINLPNQGNPYDRPPIPMPPPEYGEDGDYSPPPFDLSNPGSPTVMKPFEHLELKAQEKELLRVMVNHFDKSMPEDPDAIFEDAAGQPIEVEQILVMDYLMSELDGLTFENKIYERLKTGLFEEFDETDTVDLNKYLNHEEPEMSSLVAELLVTPDTSPKWSEIRPDLSFDGNLRMVSDGAILHYKIKKVDKLLAECQKKLKVAQEKKDDELMDKALETFMSLKETRKEVFKQLGTEGAIGALDGEL